MRTLLILFLASWSFKLLAHGTIDHSKEKAPIVETNQKAEPNQIYSKINTEYIKRIKPIFIKSCFDCHGSISKYPWYYKLPVVKQLMDSDIEEAKMHLDLTGDFPFKGHGTPLKDIIAIGKNIKSKKMPPLRYSVMHRGSSLTKDELKQVDKWIIESKEMLKR